MPPVKRSPLAPASHPVLPPIAGARIAALPCGIRYKERKDLCLFEFAPGTAVAGVFTRSLTAGAPVEWCKAALKGKVARAFLVNSGNSNAFTGRVGRKAVKLTASAAAKLMRCKSGEVFVASTGVIGEPLPYERIVGAIPDLIAGLDGDNWRGAAEAIMTTDTFPKLATRTARLGGVDVVLNGVAKGSGMIAPDMATMLAFCATDAAIPAPILQTLLADATNKSFNCITVDSDTSTSDTLLLAATGAAGNRKPKGPRDPALRDFRAALDDLLLDLALQVVKDGEGATKFVEIAVTGAANAAAARRIGLAIANSPLVKTAIAGQDANWGRIVAAVGKSGERADRDKLQVRIGGVLVAKNGGRVPDYDEAPVAAHMRGEAIEIAVEIGIAKGSATVWTCDLTHGYIDINGSYRS
ncbi:MAG: bifunctional glutamate N-acetyltransferase/amino-acid acetyltransferase ArgJ [Rhodospirillaceae bacterium]|nr:bifunctional glutamate N-acetyltransferase/amino-acid acetyltransferase ArgJ [Rhodospirillaceae bacterium]